MKVRVAIFTLSLLAVPCFAQDAASTTVALSDLPPAVQKGIQAHLAGLTLVKIDRIPENASVIYDINVTKDGLPRTFTVGSTGELVSAQVLMAETPASVQKTIQAQLATNTINRIEKTIEEDDVTYDVLMNTPDGTTLHFSVDPNGKLLQQQVLAAQVPAAVLKTMKAQAATGKLGDINKIIGEDGVTYASEVEYTGGQTRDISVLPDGQLDSVQYFLPETSTAVQKAIQAQVGAGQLGDIVRSYAGSDFTYNVRMTGQDGVARSFSLLPTGVLKSREMFLAETPLPVQNTIKELSKQAKLDEIEQFTLNESTVYNVTLIRGGASRDCSIAADGKIQSMEMGLAEVPVNVQKAITAQVGTGKIESIEEDIASSGTTYEIEIIGKDSRPRYFVLGEDGKLQTLKVYLDEAPAAVQTTINARLQQGKLDNIEKVIDADGISYDVDIIARNGSTRSLTIDEDGQVE